MTQDGHLESLIQSVILQHSALAGLPQGTAEEYYILAAQQLEGYGLETFEAKVRSTVVVQISLAFERDRDFWNSQDVKIV